MKIIDNYLVIYKCTNLLDGKFYIGYSENVEKRKQRHIRDSVNSKRHFYHAIRLYGPENFTWEVIDSSAQSIEELKQLEIKYIAELKPQYNMTAGGDGGTGMKHSHSSKEIMRQKALARPRFSQTHRNNIAISNTKKIVSQETREKMSKAHKGRVKSPEECLKISLSKKGKKIAPLKQESRKKISEAIKLFYKNKRELNAVFKS